jgi:site-specific DNA recombinase
MVAYFKANPSVRVILVEKTDRLYRNIRDWVTIDELDVEIHLPKEGCATVREIADWLEKLGMSECGECARR